MKFWLCAVVMIFGQTVVSKPYRALSTSEAGAWFFDTTNTLPVQQGFAIHMEPVAIWAVYPSQLERLAALDELTPDLANILVYEQNTERFFQWQGENGFIQVYPGTPPPPPFVGLHVAATFDIPPPEGMSQFSVYWSGVNGTETATGFWNGQGAFSFDIGFAGIDTPGVYTLIVSALDGNNTGVMFGSIDADLTTVTGELSGVLAISSETVITGVSGVFAGRDGGLSQYTTGGA